MKTYLVTAKVTTVVDEDHPVAFMGEEERQQAAKFGMEFAIRESFLGGDLRDDESIEITVEEIG